MELRLSVTSFLVLPLLNSLEMLKHGISVTTKARFRSARLARLSLTMGEYFERHSTLKNG